MKWGNRPLIHKRRCRKARVAKSMGAMGKGCLAGGAEVRAATQHRPTTGHPGEIVADDISRGKECRLAVTGLMASFSIGPSEIAADGISRGRRLR
jgi:hypothetical protein